MQQQIFLTDNTTGNEYTLKFTLASVSRMEKLGFSPNALENAPIDTVYKLFHGAFLADKPRITRTVTDRLWNEVPGSQKKPLREALTEMYVECTNALLGGDDTNSGENADTGNVTWRTA